MHKLSYRTAIAGVAGLLLGFGAVSSRAAIITTIHASHDADFLDDSHDGTVNSTLTSGASDGRISYTTASVGGGRVIRYVVSFDPTPTQRTQLLAAPSGDIQLNLYLNNSWGPPATNASVAGLTNQTSATVATGDMYATSSTVSTDLFTPTSNPSKWYSFDITSFAQAQLTASSSNILKFRVQMDGSWSDPGSFTAYDLASLGNQGITGSTIGHGGTATGSTGDYAPTLTIVPEPLETGVMGAIFVGMVLIIQRRRRPDPTGK